MTYSEATRYLESFINYEKIPVWSYKESLKLERIRGFLAVIGNPQDTLRCIHIAGTKGKGSTACFIAYILREAGFKVGLYTSPHLSDFRERIRILGPRPETRDPRPEFEGMISKDDLMDLVERLKPAIENYNQDSKYGPLSFFEVYTALAFVYFKERKVDFSVLETGLGGRLDATNVVYPLVCAITPISFDHTQKLGNTLREIATEKAGIIKTGYGLRDTGYRTVCYPIVISAPQEKEASEVIRQKCKKVGARLYEVNKDILYETTTDAKFNVRGIFGVYLDLKIRLLGQHQVINATTAVGAVEALGAYNVNIGIDSIRAGLYNTVWPGRCEVVSKEPAVILDGAQNIASSRVLKETIRESFKYEKLILVLGVSKDKDIKGICNELGDFADEVVLTRANNRRAAEPEVLAEYFKGKQTHITRNVEEAKSCALRTAGEEDLVLVCGSLFIVGEFRDGKIRPG